MVEGLISIRRALDLLTLQPLTTGSGKERPGPAEGSELVEPDCGVSVPPGRITAPVSADSRHTTDATVSGAFIPTE